jgi:hypothetical protein
MTKTLILSFLLSLATLTSFADQKGKSIEDQKKEAFQMIEEATTALQTAKTCFTEAADQAAFEKCHENLKEQMKKCKKNCHCDWKKGKHHKSP